MTNDPISRVAIIGTGQMGPTIAVATPLAGCLTTLIGCAMVCRLRPGHQPHPRDPPPTTANRGPPAGYSRKDLASALVG